MAVQCLLDPFYSITQPIGQKGLKVVCECKGFYSGHKGLKWFVSVRVKTCRHSRCFNLVYQWADLLLGV